MRSASPLFLLAVLGACTPPTVPDKPAPRTTTGATDLDRARADLEERLARVEKQLGVAKEQDRETLLEQRLALTIALAELARRADYTTGAPDLDELLEAAERRVAEARVKPRPPAQQRKARPKSLRRPPAPGKKEAKKAEEKADKARADKDSPAAEDVPPPPPPPLEEDETEGDETTREKAQVEDEERPSGLMSAVRRKAPQIEECIADVGGDVTLQVTIRLDANGAVREPKVAGVAAQPAACVAEVLRSVTVAGYSGSTRVVRFPLYFGT